MGEPGPSLFDEDASVKALDLLFQETLRYRTSQEFRQVLAFSKRFRNYAPYNCFLLHIQHPGAKYLATPYRWQNEFRRSIKPDARTLIILKPFGPVEFLYDIQDTEGAPVPEHIVNFFGAKGDVPREVWTKTKLNCERDFIAVAEESQSSKLAGVIGPASKGQTVLIRVGRKSSTKELWEKHPARYAITLNNENDRTTQYATLVHELAHLYCGHLGSPNEQWWPTRQNLSKQVREFEAESVSWLVCERLGVESPAARYLDGYLDANNEIPAEMSLEHVLKAAGHIEKMGHETLKLRKEN